MEAIKVIEAIGNGYVADLGDGTTIERYVGKYRVSFKHGTAYFDKVCVRAGIFEIELYVHNTDLVNLRGTLQTSNAVIKKREYQFDGGSILVPVSNCMHVSLAHMNREIGQCTRSTRCEVV